MPSPWNTSPSPRRSDWISLVNWISTQHALESGNHPVHEARVLHHLGAVEGGAQDRGVRVLAAQPAADAAVDHRRDRVAAQWIGVVLDRQRRAARQADARVVAGARVLVDAVLDAHHARAGGDFLRDHGPELALLLQLALAFGDDDLQALVVRIHRLLQRLRHRPDPVVVHGPDPADADALQGAFDADLRFMLAVLRRGGQLLRAGGRAVAVLHDDQDAVVLVEHGIGDARGQPVVPEAAVAHDR